MGQQTILVVLLKVLILMDDLPIALFRFLIIIGVKGKMK